MDITQMDITQMANHAEKFGLLYVKGALAETRIVHLAMFEYSGLTLCQLDISKVCSAESEVTHYVQYIDCQICIDRYIRVCGIKAYQDNLEREVE